MIVGPTAVGKSSLALELAHRYNGEIVSADSRQVYRHMDIGTAKPTPHERSIAPHHLIDIINPDDSFNVAMYQDMAYKTINDIQQRNRLPFLVGGTCLYVWATLEGWNIPQVPPNNRLRQELEERAKNGESDRLYQELQELDPSAAGRIDPRNVRRVIRALEVCHTTGKPFSHFRTKNPPAFNTLIVGLTAQRDELYRRIDSRVDSMIGQGLVEEVRELLNRGYSADLPAMSSVGYREIIQFLDGEMDLSAAAQRIKFETHRFARHQYAWFRLDDERIRWLDINEEVRRKALELVNQVRG